MIADVRLFLLCALCCLLQGLVGSAVTTVTTFSALQTAITSGSVTTVYVGGSIAFPNQIVLPKNSRVTLIGQNAATQFITSGSNRLFMVTANSSLSVAEVSMRNTQASLDTAALGGGLIYSNGSVSLSGVMLDGAIAACGSSIYSYNGTVVLTNVTVADGEATAQNCGGAVYATNSVVNISQSVFVNNTAFAGAAVYATMRTRLHVTDSTFVANVAVGSDGGALAVVAASSATITDAVFTDNAAAANGGAISLQNAHHNRITRVSFARNNASSDGGSLALLNAGARVSTSQFSESVSASDGGAIAVTGGYLSMSASQLELNAAENSGGALFCAKAAHVTVADSAFDANFATSYGGAISVQQQCRLTLHTSTLSHSVVPLTESATSSGGDVSCASASVTVVASQFASSFAGLGGAIYAFACPVTIALSQFTNITAQDSAVYAAGGSSVAISGSAFRNNSATSYSSGVSCFSSLACHATNTTFAYSRSLELGTFFVDSAAASLTDCHFLHNVASGAGAGVYAKAATVAVHNSSFVGNAAFTFGAAITAEINSRFTVAGCVFANNSAASGGAVYGFFDAAIDVRNSSFSGNTATDGGGALYIAAGSTANVSDALFVDNFAPLGAALYASDDTTLRLERVAAFGNRAGYAGGVAAGFNGARLDVASCVFANNSAALGGALSLQYESALALRDSSLVDNTASLYGGALFVTVSSTATIAGCSVTGNVGALGGGALQLEQSAANLSASTFAHNVGAYGGVVQTIAAALRAEDCVFASNGGADVYEGGAIALGSESSLVSRRCVYTANEAQQGGALVARLSVVDLADDELRGCRARASACVLALQSSRVVLQSTTLHDNALQRGELGGVLSVVGGNFSATNVSVARNTVQTQGALTLLSTNVRIAGCRFEANAAVASAAVGAAVFLGCATPCDAVDVAALVNGSSFVGNSAASGAGGGVAVAGFPGAVVVAHSIFAQNRATDGGAIAVSLSVVNVSRCVFASNVAAQGGGGVYWRYSAQFPTTVDAASCDVSDNVAAYGAFVATNLVALAVASPVGATASGRALTTPISVALRDAYGQTVTNASAQLSAAETAVYVAVTNSSGLLRGSSIVAPVNGTAQFAQIVLVGRPGGTLSLSFSVATAAVAAVALSVPLRLCEPGEITLPVAGSSFAVCEPCTAGTYSFSPSDAACTPCPQHATCPGGALVDVAAGYWRTSDVSAQILACPVPQACRGGVNASTQCATGQEGPYCSVCAPHYAPTGTGLCYSCASSGALATELVPVVLFAALLVVLLVAAKKSKQLLRWYARVNRRVWQNRRFRTLRVKGKILVAFAQIVYQLGPAFNVVFPVNFLTYLHFYSFFSLNLAFLPDFNCVVRTDFYTDLVVSTVAPVALYAAIALALQVMVVHARRLNERNPYYTAARAKSDTIAALFVLSYFVLISVSTKIFEVFECETFDDGSSFLVADYSIDCSDPRYAFYRVYGVVMICVYPVGIPLAYAAILVRHRHRINPDWRRVIDAREKAVVSNHVVQREKAKVRKTYEEIRNLSLLYDSYTPRRWYFEVFDCVRRLLLGAVPVLILRGSSLQIVIVLLVSLGSVGVFMVTSPYIHRHDNQLAVLAQWSITLVVLASLVIKIEAMEGENDGLGVLLILLNVFVVAASIASAVINSRRNPLHQTRPQSAARAKGAGRGDGRGDVDDGASGAIDMTTFRVTTPAAAAPSPPSPPPPTVAARRDVEVDSDDEV
eukprot:gene5490-3912_t